MKKEIIDGAVALHKAAKSLARLNGENYMDINNHDLTIDVEDFASLFDDYSVSKFKGLDGEDYRCAKTTYKGVEVFAMDTVEAFEKAELRTEVDAWRR